MKKPLIGILLTLGVIFLISIFRNPLEKNTQPRGDSPNQLWIWAAGDLFATQSTSTTPGDALTQLGIPLAPEDQIIINGNPTPHDQTTPLQVNLIQLNLAIPLTIIDNNQEQRIYTTAPTIGQALWDAGIQLYLADKINPAPETPLTTPITVQIQRARTAQITIANVTIQTRTTAQTVGGALADAGLALQALDYTVPADNMPLPPDGEIEIIRVQEEIILEQEPIPFETAWQGDPTIEIDTQSIIQVGQYGLRASRVRVRYENGIEISRQTEAEWVAAEPQNRIVGYGTKIVIRTITTGSGTIEYWRAVSAFATSYSPCRLGIPDLCGYTTASGLPLKKGLVGVIRSWFNVMVFQNVYVEGYGVGTIADIGAGIAGQNWIDLGYEEDDWVGWAQNVTIYFLTPVPPEENILWILP